MGHSRRRCVPTLRGTMEGLPSEVTQRGDQGVLQLVPHDAHGHRRGERQNMPTSSHTQKHLSNWHITIMATRNQALTQTCSTSKETAQSGFLDSSQGCHLSLLQAESNSGHYQNNRKKKKENKVGLNYRNSGNNLQPAVTTVFQNPTPPLTTRKWSRNPLLKKANSS